MKLSKIPFLRSNNLQSFEQIEQKTPEILHFHFFIVLQDCAMMPYQVKKRLKTYKMAMSILLRFLTLKWDISRTIWRIEVSDGSLFFFCIFHTLSFELDFFSTGVSL